MIHTPVGRRRERTVPQEYEQSQAIEAPPEEVFAWLSDVGNLPEYLPPVVASSVVGPSAEGVPGQRIRTTLEYPGQGGGTFEAEGYLAVDEQERRMEWGAEAGRDYSGWLTVANHTEGASELVLHLSFGERCAGSEMREQAPERQSTPWRRHNGDAWEHPAAERGGFGQGGGPASARGGRAATGGEPGGGRRGSPA